MIKFYFKIVHDESLSKVIILHRLILLLNILLYICVSGIYHVCVFEWMLILCSTVQEFQSLKWSSNEIPVVGYCTYLCRFCNGGHILLGRLVFCSFLCKHLWWVFFLIVFRVPLSASEPKKENKQGGSF